MRKLLTVLTILFFFFGIQTLLLGGVYKIQSWEMPEIGGFRINLLAVGLVIIGLALNLMILKNNWSEFVSGKGLELDERRLEKAEEVELSREENEQIV